MAKESATLGWQRALVVLTGTVVGAVVVSCLYWAQIVFIPFALAVFLSFLLAPLVTILQRRGLGRMPSVILVALLTAAALGGIVVLFASEAASLARDLPTYTVNLKERIRSLRELGQGSVMEGLEKMSQELSAEWTSQPVAPQKGAAGEVGGPVPAATEKQITVIVPAESSSWLSRLPGLLRPLVAALGGLALALVLAVFMLLKRENLRNRLIRLVGHGRMTTTTKALDDAGQRISRFLLVQLAINCCFGIVLSIGLLLLQVPHALLYGLDGGHPALRPLPRKLDNSGHADDGEPGHLPGVGAAAPGFCVDRGPRAGHGERRGAEIIRPQHGRLGSGPADGRRLLGLPVGAGRPGPVQPADGLSVGPG